MTPPTYTRAHGLSEQQHKAVALIVYGRTDTQIAEEIGVARETVTRWRLYDATFRAALDERRQELWLSATDSVRSILPQAVQTMFEQLRINPNRGRLALDFITRAGLMGKPYSGLLGAFDDPTAGDAANDESFDTNGAESHSVTQDHTISPNGAAKVT